MKQASHQDPTSTKLIIGIITNSDDRIPSILSSLGLKVGSRRHGLDKAANLNMEEDISFVAMSYDVGVEKPAHDIFDAATELVPDYNPANDRLVHVGDDPLKDFHGAEAAGWEGLLLDRRGLYGTQSSRKDRCISALQAVVPYISGYGFLDV